MALMHGHAHTNLEYMNIIKVPGTCDKNSRGATGLYAQFLNVGSLKKGHQLY
jgi:hypothetical protein